MLGGSGGCLGCCVHVAGVGEDETGAASPCSDGLNGNCCTMLIIV